MTDQAMVALNRLGKVFGDRVIVRRLNEPEKKRGLYIPAAYAGAKKELKKAWWALVVGFGDESVGQTEYGLKIGDRVGVEPLGNHYAGFMGEDGYEYLWVPDEHVCLADDGSVLDYYADKLNPGEQPRLRVIGDRLLIRPVADEQKGRIIRTSSGGERQSAIGEVVKLGEVAEEKGVSHGDKILYMAEESGSSCQVSIFDPALIILRSVDLMVLLDKVPAVMTEATMETGAVFVEAKELS